MNGLVKQPPGTPADGLFFIQLVIDVGSTSTKIGWRFFGAPFSAFAVKIFAYENNEQNNIKAVFLEPSYC